MASLNPLFRAFPVLLNINLILCEIFFNDLRVFISIYLNLLSTGRYSLGMQLKKDSKAKLWLSMISMLLCLLVLTSAFGQNRNESLLQSENLSFVDDGLFLSQSPSEKDLAQHHHFTSWASVEEESKDPQTEYQNSLFTESKFNFQACLLIPFVSSLNPNFKFFPLRNTVIYIVCCVFRL